MTKRSTKADPRKIVRVFHPTLDSFSDVPESVVEEWTAAGWLKSKPKHVEIPDGTPKPGEGPGIAQIPTEIEDVSSTTTSSGRSGGRSASTGGSASTASSARGGRSTGTGAASSASTSTTTGGSSAGSKT